MTSTATNNNDDDSLLLVGANLDLVREILLRLSAASILRFKLVSKEWRGVLSDPYFLDAYNRRRRRSWATGVLSCDFAISTAFENTSCSIADGSRVFPEPPEIFDSYDNVGRVFHGLVLDTCNGLLVGDEYPLTHPTPPNDVDVVDDENNNNYNNNNIDDDIIRSVMVVYNPTTLQRRVLPNSSRDHYRGVVLAFDPWRSLNYRVILLNVDHDPHEITVYRSETNSWHTLFSSTDQPWIASLIMDGYRRCRCFCNGLVHWFTTDGFLITIDVDKASFSKSKTPCLPTTTTIINDQKCDISYCGQSRGGHLRVIRLIRSHSIHFDPSDPAEVLQVLEHNASDSGNEWLLLHTIHIKDLCNDICKLERDYNVASCEFMNNVYFGLRFCCLLEEDDDQDDDKLMLVLGKRILAYGLRSRIFHVLNHRQSRLDGRLMPCTNTFAAP